jgi:hypothetical protein
MSECGSFLQPSNFEIELHKVCYFIVVASNKRVQEDCVRRMKNKIMKKCEMRAKKCKAHNITLRGRAFYLCVILHEFFKPQNVAKHGRNTLRAWNGYMEMNKLNKMKDYGRR